MKFVGLTRFDTGGLIRFDADGLILRDRQRGEVQSVHGSCRQRQRRRPVSIWLHFVVLSLVRNPPETSGANEKVVKFHRLAVCIWLVYTVYVYRSSDRPAYAPGVSNDGAFVFQLHTTVGVLWVVFKFMVCALDVNTSSDGVLGVLSDRVVGYPGGRIHSWCDLRQRNCPFALRRYDSLPPQPTPTLFPSVWHRRVQAVALQGQVRAALGQTIDEIAHRLAWVSQRMTVLKDMIGRSLELLRALIKVCILWAAALCSLPAGF